MATEYPPLTEAIENARLAIAIGKIGWEGITAQRAEFGKSVWRVQGYIQSVTLGDLPMIDGPAPVEFGEMLDTLEPLATPQVGDQPESVFEIISMIMAIIKILQKFLGR